MPAWSWSSELREQPYVVFVELFDVVDAVQEHRHTIDTHAEREAAHCLRVVADVLEHHGMDHPAAEYLQPATAAIDVDLAARLDERKVAGPKAHRRVCAKQRGEEAREHALQV